MKQIGEHIAEFDTIWDKVQSAPTPNLKEKYEADLKREIKKLQRLRDACKVFIAQHEVKNKNPLLDVRKQIEEKMEQFKVLEKQTKTKAYSKEGLAASAKQRQGAGGAGAEDEKREEVKGWLDEMSEALQGQYDEMEKKLETAKESGKSKKKAKGSVATAAGESVEDIQRVMDRQQFHIAQIELIKERLDEEGVTPDEVEGLRDGLENYVSNHLEADFEEDEALYDDIDLTEREEAPEGAEEEPEGKEGVEEEEEQAEGEEKEPKEAEAYSPTKGKIASSAAPVAAARPTININTRTTGVIQTSKPPTPAASPSAAASAALTTKTTSPPTTAATTPITRITPTAATPVAGKPALSIAPLSAVGKKATPAAAPAPVTSASIAAAKPMESMASIVMKGTGKVDEQRRTAAGTATVTPITPITSITPIASTAAAGTRPPLPAAGVATPSAAKPAAAAAVTIASRVEQGRPPLIAPIMKINTSAPPAVGSTAANTAQTPTSASQPASAASSAPSFHSPPVSPAPFPTAISSPSAVSLPSTGSLSRPSSSASLGVPDDVASIASSMATIGSSMSVSPPAMSLSSVSSIPPFDSTGYTFASAVPSPTIASTTSPTASTASTSAFSAASSTPSTHRDRGLIPDDYFSTLQLLDASLHHFPQPADTDRPKPYTPRNPYRTPPYFPSTPPAIFDDPALFSHLTVDTLFFIFYFQQGTPHQYLAARELKKQSWRYHKNFLTWFQRHDDPKLTSDEYETGTYVYFDYESGWCQRIKAEFTFEYRHLECEDIEGIASQVTQFGRA